VFGVISWLLFVVCAAVGAGVVLGLTLGLSRLRGRTTGKRSGVIIAAMLVGVVAAFPVGAEWDEEGHRASGLVPAAQALMAPIWPRSAWTSQRPRPPVLEYAYTCCG
jgi:hypothetical protein